MTNDELFMQRAFELAENGRGEVSPNPMVGCVLVVNGRIVGEGWHQQYGGPHAEVQAVRDAQAKGHAELLPEATAFVTLEPCSHTGKTPPCASLLIEKKVKRVVVANDDPNPLVAGQGLGMLREAGIEVQTGMLSERGRELNRRFFTFFEKKRPYLVLKWAETADGFIATEEGGPIQISNARSSRRVHQWRSWEDGILVGRQTALADNPRLNVRLWPGRNPVRIVLDRTLSLPPSLHLFDQSQSTLVYNYHQHTDAPTSPERYAAAGRVAYSRITPGNDEIEQILSDLYHRKIQSVLVEGGPQIQEAFIRTGYWDEIRRCQSPNRLGSGLSAPAVAGALVNSEQIEDDHWTYYRP